MVGRAFSNQQLIVSDMFAWHGLAWFGYYFSALGGGLGLQVAHRGEENLLFRLLFLVFG